MSEQSYEDLVMSGNADPPADNTQAVADDDAPAQQGAQIDAGAQEPDLDTLLAEFDASQGQAPSQPDLSAELEQARAAAQHDHWRADYAEQQIQQIAQQTQNEKHLRDLKELCGAVKGDLPVSDELVDLWLGSEAQRHPELLQAYINRDSNAAGYQQLKAYAAREFFKFVRTIPDPEASETKAIVSHAVRGASTSSPPEDPAPNFGAMSDNELREYTRKNFNFV